MLRHNCHFSTHLQAAWNKYGEENFEFSILEEIKNFEQMTIDEMNETLLKREEFWIKKYKSDDRNFGYNSRVVPSTNLGLKWSEESKRAFSEAKKGKPIKHLEGVAKELWKNPEFRKTHAEKYRKWWTSFPEDAKKELIERRTKKLKEINHIKRTKYGEVVSKEQKRKAIETGLKNGSFKTVYLYFPNGKYLGEFLTRAQCLVFLKLNPKNGCMINNRIDAYFLHGLIPSYTKYTVYPKNLLQNITSQKVGEYIVTNIITHQKFLRFNKSKIHKEFNIPENLLNEKNFTNNQLIIKNYKIEKLAPIIGDDNSGIGEFIENLYQDDNELSLGVKNLGKCND